MVRLSSLLLLVFLCFSLSSEEGDTDWINSLLGALGTSATGLAGMSNSQAQAQIAAQIAAIDAELAAMGITPGTTKESCLTDCDKKCCGAETYCKTLTRSYTCPNDDTTHSSNCSAKNDAKTCIVPASDCPVSELTCECKNNCKDYGLCKQKCEARASLNKAKIMNWNSLLAILGVAASTLSGIDFDKKEEERTCQQKCAGLSGRDYDNCMKNNTNEYGESCDYTVSGKCDETDPMVKEGVCESWDGGCARYKRQCSCNLRAEQTKGKYVWDDKKNDCVVAKDSTNKEDSYASGASETDPVNTDDTKKDDESNKKLASASGGGSSLKGGASGAGAKPTAAGKGDQVKDPKKASLGDTAGGSFKDQNYMGMVGESGGTQGSSSSNKKPTDVGSSKEKDTLMDMIHKTYTDYTDAGRFLSAEYKEVEVKQKKIKRAKRG